jgi:hypothetical protein
MIDRAGVMSSSFTAATLGCAEAGAPSSPADAPTRSVCAQVDV